MHDDTIPQTAFVIIDNDSGEPSKLFLSAETIIRDLHKWSYRGGSAWMLTVSGAVWIAEHSEEQNEHNFTELKPASPWQPHQHKVGTTIHFKAGDGFDAGKIDALVIGTNGKLDKYAREDTREWIVGYVVDDEFVAETDVIAVIGKAVSDE